MSIVGYVDETLFEVRYGRIASNENPNSDISSQGPYTLLGSQLSMLYLLRYRMTPTIEEYAQILSFPHNPCRTPS